MARDFNGSNQYISYTLDSSQTDLSQVTVAHWFYADSTAGYRRFWQLANTYPNDQLQCEFDDGYNGWAWQARFSSARGTWTINKPSTGSWQHFCGTHDLSSTSNDPVLYINGVSQTITERSAPSGTRSNTSTTFTIGRDTDGTQYWDGKGCEFAIWNRILSADEVAILAEGYSPSFIRNGLVMYLPLIGRATAEPDLVKAVTGSLTNSPAAAAHPRIYYPAPFQTYAVAAAAPAGGQPIARRISTVPFLGGSLRQATINR